LVYPGSTPFQTVHRSLLQNIIYPTVAESRIEDKAGANNNFFLKHQNIFTTLVLKDCKCVMHEFPGKSWEILG